MDYIRHTHYRFKGKIECARNFQNSRKSVVSKWRYLHFRRCNSVRVNGRSVHSKVIIHWYPLLGMFIIGGFMIFLCILYYQNKLL